MEELGAFSTVSVSSSKDPPEDKIQQRIVDIRKQLDDTYNIFVNAKEQLSDISFENLNERMNVTEVQATQAEEVLVVDSNCRIDVVKSLHKLGSPAGKPTASAKYEDIPELNKLFRVMADLKEGIKKINMHQESITELNADIDQYMEQANTSTLDDQFANINLEEHLEN